ncbi:MAG: hypothetical protein JKX81_07860 [Arenicella sp.]|nr:hypothetical protein [Arenicella sp.]
MVNLKSYYDSRVLELGEEQLLEQVGHTEYGKAISANQFHKLTEELNSLLDLNSHDVMLDLACGNGVISKLMAQNCR